MATVGTLSVDLIAQTASFNSNIEKAAANLNSTSARMSRSLQTIEEGTKRAGEGMKLLVEALAVREIAESVKGSLEFAAAMKVQADQIGVTSEQLQLLHLAGKRVGATNEDVDTGLKRLTVSLGKAELGAKAQQTVFNALGVDYHHTAAQAIPELADALSKVGDASKRHALEVLTMGRAAVTLDPLFKQGAEGLKKFQDEAEKAGLILGSEFSEKAHEASVKMDELVQIMKIDFSKEVINNADAIVGLARALEQATVGAIHFIAQHPRLTTALAGAAIGARFGPYGAAAGAAIGYRLGDDAQREADLQNPDLAFRQKQTLAAIAELHRRQAEVNSPSFKAQNLVRRLSGGTPIDPKAYITDAISTVQAETDSTRSALALAHQGNLPPLGPDGIGNILAGHGHKVADHTDEWQKAYEDQNARLDEQILAAKKANYTDVSQIADFSKQEIDVEAKKLNTDLTIAERKNPILAAHDAILREKIEQVAAEKKLTIDTATLLKKWNDDLDMQIAANDNQKELLSAQEQLTVTIADHRKIQLQILAVEEANLKLELQKQLLNSKDVKERERIQAQIDAVPGVYAARAEVVKQQNLTPLEAYLKSTDPRTINDRVNSLVVDELNAVRTGIDDGITNALGVKDPFLKGIIDLFIEQVLIRPIGEALQKITAQSSGGGLFGSIIGAIFGGGGGGATIGGQTGAQFAASMTIPGFATGTDNAPAGLAWVGEKGPELIKFRGGEQVFNQSQLSAANGNTIVMNNDFRGADAAAVSSITAKLDQLDRNLEGRSIAAVADARERRMIR